MIIETRRRYKLENSPEGEREREGGGGGGGGRGQKERVEWANE